MVLLQINHAICIRIRNLGIDARRKTFVAVSRVKNFISMQRIFNIIKRYPISHIERIKLFTGFPEKRYTCDGEKNPNIFSFSSQTSTFNVNNVFAHIRKYFYNCFTRRSYLLGEKVHEKMSNQKFPICGHRKGKLKLYFKSVSFTARKLLLV